MRGRSQAGRLPREFRLTGTEVRIRRRGPTLILEPLPRDWGWLDALSGKFDADAQVGAKKKPGDQDRPELDRLFST